MVAGRLSFSSLVDPMQLVLRGMTVGSAQLKEAVTEHRRGLKASEDLPLRRRRTSSETDYQAVSNMITHNSLAVRRPDLGPSLSHHNT